MGFPILSAKISPPEAPPLPRNAPHSGTGVGCVPCTHHARSVSIPATAAMMQPHISQDSSVKIFSPVRPSGAWGLTSPMFCARKVVVDAVRVVITVDLFL